MSYTDKELQELQSYTEELAARFKYEDDDKIVTVGDIRPLLELVMLLKDKIR